MKTLLCYKLFEWWASIYKEEQETVYFNVINFHINLGPSALLGLKHGPSATLSEKNDWP